MKTDLHIFNTNEDRDIAFHEAVKVASAVERDFNLKSKKFAFKIKDGTGNKVVQYTSMESLYSPQLKDLDDENTTAIFRFPPTDEEYLLVCKHWNVKRGVF